jgi:hypothetical protein
VVTTFVLLEIAHAAQNFNQINIKTTETTFHQPCLIPQAPCSFKQTKVQGFFHKNCNTMTKRPNYPPRQKTSNDAKQLSFQPTCVMHCDPNEHTNNTNQTNTKLQSQHSIIPSRRVNRPKFQNMKGILATIKLSMTSKIKRSRQSSNIQFYCMSQSVLMCMLKRKIAEADGSAGMRLLSAPVPFKKSSQFLQADKLKQTD